MKTGRGFAILGTLAVACVLSRSLVAGGEANRLLPPSSAPRPPPAAEVPEATDVRVDAASKEYSAQPGEMKHVFVFRIANASPEAPLVIHRVNPSCGCSIAKTPAQPWRLAPGESGEFSIEISFPGKSGVVTKTATIETDRGRKIVSFQVTIPKLELPPGPEGVRLRNLEKAAADRQAVFKGDCASCHAAPAAGKRGEPLYRAVCGICHEAEHRATMVPDLHALPQATTPAYWRSLIIAGKANTLMPGFARDLGGPLEPVQIESLVEYLSREFTPAHPAADAKDH